MKVGFIFLMILFQSAIYTQTPPYYHYTSSNGLPSATCFDIIQDDDGYIWIATGNGLSRFNGSRFKNFGIKDGLNSITTVGFTKRKNGELFISNYEMGINVLKDGIISSYTKRGSDQIRFEEIFFINDSLYAVSNSGYLISFENGVSSIKDVLGNPSTLPMFPYFRVNRFIRSKDESLIGFTTEGIYRYVNWNFVKWNIEGFGNYEVFHGFEDSDKNLYAGGSGKIYIIKNDKLIKTITTENKEDKIFKIFVDSRKNIWFSVMNKGFRVIYNGSEKIFDMSKKLKIPLASVNKFYEDNEGNIWVSTFGKGVFCLNNQHISNYNEDEGLSNNNVQAIVKDSFGRIVAGTYNGLNFLDNGIVKTLKHDKNITDYIHSLYTESNKIFVCKSVGDSKVHKQNFLGSDLNMFNSLSFLLSTDTIYYCGGWGNEYWKCKRKFDEIDNIFFPIFGEKFITNRVNKIFEDSENNIWFATGNGVCKMKNIEKTYFNDNEILGKSIKWIEEDKFKNVWFAGENGIAKLNIKTSSITDYKNVNELDLSSSTSITFDIKNRAWIGNMNGLIMFDNSSAKIFNRYSGLPANDILSLYYDNEKNILWIGTSQGLTSFDISYYEERIQKPLSVKIEYIRSGDSIYSVNSNLEFEPEDNNIQIALSVPYFSSPSSLKYQYKIAEEWIDSENNHLDFSSMEKGEYNILVRARSQDSDWSEVSMISFEIKPRFTQTIFFYSLILVLIAGIILTSARYRINLTKKRSREHVLLNRRMNELKHQALSAMMNPHFIFNSLNSVQYLVNKDQKEDANDYISMMARLIRKNLDTSESSFLLLQEEIERLKLYLDIEKLRFQRKFSHEIIVGNDIDAKRIRIPNMIVQPFVENAVWHGLMNLDENGTVTVSFEFENVNIESQLYKCLVIRIRDNGVGLEQSVKQKLNNGGHISKGIRIIEERLKLLSDDLNLPQPIIIEDLSRRSQKTTGTEVIISLPPTLYKNNEE